MANIEIPHTQLKATYHFSKAAGGQWYNPAGSSDHHVHLIGKNYSPGYDPVKNPRAPEVLSVEKVELKVDSSHQWWGEPQANGTFKFNETTISKWGITNKSAAKALLSSVPNLLVSR